ncbi:MAG: alpha/beta fold hydrolase [Burkholderiales bacterium]
MDPLARNHVTVAGNATAPRTMVFVHGLGTDQGAWRDVWPAFADDHRIVLLDNVGAGRSDPTAFVQTQYLNLHGYARDLVQVWTALDLAGAVVVGHSVGAMVAVLASIAAPGRCAKLVLLNASPRYLDDRGYRGGFSRGDLDAIYSAVSRNFVGWADGFAPTLMGHPDRPQLAQHFADTLKQVPAAHALTILCSIFQSDHRADLARIAVPTLIVQTRDDPAVPPEVAAYLHAHIPGSRLATIEATGHLPHVSAPAQVVAAIRGFL